MQETLEQKDPSKKEMSSLFYFKDCVSRTSCRKEMESWSRCVTTYGNNLNDARCDALKENVVCCGSELSEALLRAAIDDRFA
jgi:hypothetical protein